MTYRYRSLGERPPGPDPDAPPADPATTPPEVAPAEERPPAGEIAQLPLASVVSVADFEPHARARMDPAAFDYVAGGSWDEVTLAENERAFRRYRLRPRVLVDVAELDTSTTLLGEPVSLPVAIAPTATQGWAHAEGEVAGARAAAAANVLFALSTVSTFSIEDVAGVGPGPRWFQLYVHKDRGLSAELVRRAAAAGYSAVVLTVDLPVAGYRLRDLRNRLPAPERFGNFGIERAERRFDAVLAGFHDQTLSWPDVEWIRATSGLPLVVKGVMTGEDAALAMDHGAAGVVVSNHGGRQLDQVSASLDVLEECVGAVADRGEVYLDSGVRRGSDVLIALALGARAVFIGRPYLYALATAGDRGVTRLLELLRGELRTAMALLGVRSPGEVTRAHVR